MFKRMLPNNHTGAVTCLLLERKNKPKSESMAYYSEKQYKSFFFWRRPTD